MTINPKVVDISHYDALVGDGFQAVRNFGIVGVIHKSSEGANIIDKPYTQRRQLARQAGLLWGAYHFIRPGNMQAQADFFLRAAQVDDQTLISLDFEVPDVPASAGREFIERVESKIGRQVVLYSGNTIKEDLGNRIDQWWGARRLWLAQYASTWKVQRSWTKPWLWQYTGDGLGPQPHNVPGISIPGGLDISSYDGSDDQLRKEWVDDAAYAAPTPTPAAPLTGLRWVQDSLNRIANAGLDVDGVRGPKTRKALSAFQSAHGLAPNGIVTDVTCDAIDKALAELHA